MEETFYKETKKHFSRLGMRFFLGTLIVYAVQVAALLIADAVSPELLDNTDMYLFITSMPMYLIAFPLLVLLVRKVPAVSIEKHKMTAGQLIQAFCIGYALIVGSNIIGLGITEIIGVFKGASVQNPMSDLATELNPITALIVMVLFAPVAEELVFRKLLMDRVVVYGEGLAIILSGFMFGLFHGNLNQFVYAFAIGAFLGFIYVKTGNIIYSVLLHMGINFMGVIASISVADQASSMESVADLKNLMTTIFFLCLYGIFVLTVVVAGIVLLIIKRREFRCNSGEKTIPKGRGFSTVILNVGMILYILFWLIMIVLQLFQ